MEHAAHWRHEHPPHEHGQPREPLQGGPEGRTAHSPASAWIAFTATIHCLAGCAIGEVLGMVIGNALGLDNLTTIVLAVALAFFFGYLLTMVPLLRTDMPRRAALRLALAADTVSITLMEIVDNAIMWVIPGAMDAGLDTLLF